MSEIKSRRMRTASGARFSVTKYKGEAIKGLVNLCVLKMENEFLDEVLEKLMVHFKITPTSESVEVDESVIAEEETVND